MEQKVKKIIGGLKCPDCGEDIEIRLDKNNKIYFCCDYCRARHWFGGANNKKGRAALSRGEKFTTTGGMTLMPIVEAMKTPAPPPAPQKPEIKEVKKSEDMLI